MKPILFNTEMVKAILEGRKTVTRRVLKLPNYIKQNENGLYTLFAEGTCYENQNMKDVIEYIKPPYAAGDILYVRETWSEWTGGYLYKAWTSPFHQAGKSSVMRWFPSIHMPKAAARIFLKVTDVRVERLRDIDLDNAIDEGITMEYVSEDPFINELHLISKFGELWDSTIKKDCLKNFGWDANPYVWVIEFERISKEEAEHGAAN